MPHVTNTPFNEHRRKSTRLHKTNLLLSSNAERAKEKCAEQTRLRNAALDYNDSKSIFYKDASGAARHYKCTSVNARAGVLHYAKLAPIDVGAGTDSEAGETAEEAVEPALVSVPIKKTKRATQQAKAKCKLISRPIPVNTCRYSRRARKTPHCV